MANFSSRETNADRIIRERFYKLLSAGYTPDELEKQLEELGLSDESGRAQLVIAPGIGSVDTRNRTLKSPRLNHSDLPDLRTRCV
jgi:hypothetical protein